MQPGTYTTSVSEKVEKSEIVKSTNVSIAEYLRQAENFQKFSDILGKDAAPYVQSAIIAASSTNDLLACTPKSVFRAALRAASLGLSCDPAVKQAWLVPYDVKVKAHKAMVDGQEVFIPEHWEKEAQFQPHYLGLYFLAMRTGKYWIINVGPIYDGQRVFENPLTGLHAVQETNGLMGQPQSYNAAYSRDVTVRRSQGKKIIGWLGYYKTTKGFEKSVYMSCEEIAEHAEKHVKGYDKNPNWQDAKKRETMEMKTVLRALLNWADKSGVEHTPQLLEALKADEQIGVEEVTPGAPDWNGTPVEWEEQPTSNMTYEEAKEVLKVDPPQKFVAPKGVSEPEPVVDLISPLSEWAVNFASKEWNLTATEAAQEIGRKKLGKLIDKKDFILIVQPVPETN